MGGRQAESTAMISSSMLLAEVTLPLTPDHLPALPPIIENSLLSTLDRWQHRPAAAVYSHDETCTLVCRV